MKWIILILALLPLTAEATLKLDPPAELLTRASQGRIQCRQVVLDVLESLPEMRERSVFEPYFNILEDLDKVAQRLKLAEIYPGAIENLGARMAAHGARWLQLSMDEKKQVLRHHGWMSPETALSYQAQIELEAKELNKLDLLKKLALTVEELVPLADRRWPERRDIRLGYRRILSEAAGRILRDTSLSETEQLAWIGRISDPGAIGTLLGELMKELLRLTPETKEQMGFISRQLIVIHERLARDPVLSPEWILGSVGDTTVELIIRSLAFERQITELPDLLKLLQLRHLQGLAQQWMGIRRLPSSAYAPHYLDLAKIMLEALRASPLRRESDDFSDFFKRIGAPILVKDEKMEGTYALTSPNGKKWRFSLAFAHQSLVYAALADVDGFVFKPFFNVSYDGETESFLASQREPDIDPTQNYTLRFRILKNGEIEVRDLLADPKQQHLRGRKIETYDDYFSDTSITDVQASGTYEGIVRFGTEYAERMTLVVTTFQFYSLARLSGPNGVSLELNIGSPGNDGNLYLTTGKLQTTWVQIRGQLRNGVFRGHSIKGGKGRSPTFEMRKISD